MGGLSGLACQTCGVTYDREPALEVACPVCEQPPGSKCVVRVPSEHVKSAAFCGLPPWGHDERDLAATAEGVYRCDHGITPVEAARRLANGWKRPRGGRREDNANQMTLEIPA